MKKEIKQINANIFLVGASIMIALDKWLFWAVLVIVALVYLLTPAKDFDN